MPHYQQSSRAHQTALARFRNGHLRSMTFVQGVPLPVPALSLLLLLIFWTAGAFPCDSYEDRRERNLVWDAGDGTGSPFFARRGCSRYLYLKRDPALTAYLQVTDPGLVLKLGSPTNFSSRSSAPPAKIASYRNLSGNFWDRRVMKRV
ncbi:hypothetical protein TNCV_4615481 [Trichonephila clavipes]|nr:hypothetical protein TNCV_4615481 [Trichonephila clavipes]